jgi:competence protein ComGF
MKERKSSKNTKQIKRSLKALSLLEMLIYVAVISILVVAITGLTFLIYRNKCSIEDRASINEDMRILIKSIRDDMYLGNTILVNGNELRITNRGSGDSIIYIEQNDQIFRQLNSDPPVASLQVVQTYRNLLSRILRHLQQPVR